MSIESDEKDIKELFDRMASHFQDAHEGAREMFSMLVRTALKYRDIVAHSDGRPLEVGETREALTVFMEVLKTHKIPQGLDRRVHDLVIMWLEELKLRARH
jgi:hypothetical protein